MTKARRDIAEAIRIHDVVIEVIDARMPRASENPMLAELRGAKPCLKVLSKSDLADPSATAAWIRYFEAQNAVINAANLASNKGGDPNSTAPHILAVALEMGKPGETRAKIAELSKKLAPRRNVAHKVVRAMVVGIPNVGKSTLINTLMERKVAKTGDEPAVTKAPQRATLKSGMQLTDHPGVMWPKNEDEEGSHCLAFGGAIPDSAIDYEIVALYGARVLLERYPKALLARYKLPNLPSSPTELIEEIGRRRGALRGGGVIDMHKAADVLIHDFRQGSLGRISLELPTTTKAAAKAARAAEAADDETGSADSNDENVVESDDDFRE